MEQTVLFDKDNAIGIITLNRPHKRNAVTSQLVRELTEALNRAVEDPEVRAIVLRGNGEGFCAGGDISDDGKVDGIVPMYHSLQNTQNVARLLSSCPKPTVVAVQGAAAGMGFSLALACDVTVCSTNAYFVMSFVNVSLIPDSGATYYLPRVVGTKKAREILLSGRKINAQEALQLGIADCVVEEPALLAAALQQAAKLAEIAPNSYGIIKMLVGESLNSTLDEMLEKECVYQSVAINSEDAKEAVQAFFERRKPNYRGR